MNMQQSQVGNIILVATLLLGSVLQNWNPRILANLLQTDDFCLFRDPAAHVWGVIFWSTTVLGTVFCVIVIAACAVFKTVACEAAGLELEVFELRAHALIMSRVDSARSGRLRRARDQHDGNDCVRAQASQDAVVPPWRGGLLLSHRSLRPTDHLHVDAHRSQL